MSAGIDLWKTLEHHHLRDSNPDDMKCPSGLDAKVGTEFDCTFTGPDGNYLAHVKITKVDGSDLEYDIETKRA